LPRRLAVIAALVVAVSLACAKPVRAQNDLPSIGDPINQVVSPQAEAALGARMMAEAHERLDLNRDPEISAYVDRLGARLAEAVDEPPFEQFTFFLVHDDTLNAFAAPGGYIGIHSGLLQAADNEAQLASVLAHEIAHVTQRHLAKAFAANQRNQYKTLAAVVAGIILASENPQAAEAAVATGQASEAQRRINYTRANEYEADRLGIRLLARAGFDAGAMASMFEILQATGGSDGAPEFLRTHPLSGNRIAEAKNRAARMEQGDARRDSLAFHLIKRRIAVVRTDNPDRLAQRWAQQEPPATSFAASAHTYGLALLDLRREAPERAIERLQRLRERSPDERHYGAALARAHAASGDRAAALEVWRHLDALYPRSFPVAALGADLLREAKSPRAAMDHLIDYLRRDPRAPGPAWRKLAQVADAADDPVSRHEALGEYYARTARLDEATRQFELALERADEGSSDHKRIAARLEQVRALKRERVAHNPVSGN